MNLNRKTLRKLILQEVRLLAEQEEKSNLRRALELNLEGAKKAEEIAKKDGILKALSYIIFDLPARATRAAFDLLSDEDHKVAEKYGSWGPKKFMGKEYDGILRQTFIVGKDGRLKTIIEKVKTKTHNEDVLNYIKENLV